MKRVLVIVMLLVGLISATTAMANPTQIYPIGSVRLSYASGGWRVAVSGTYAYVVEYNRLSVFDISNPAAPSLVATTLQQFQGGKDVIGFGRYMFVSGFNVLDVVDVVNPASPVVVSEIPNMGGVKMAMSGNYLIAASGYGGYNTTYGPWGLQVIDFSQPTAPVMVATVALPAPASNVAISGNFAFVADQDGGLQVVDISQPAVPRQVTSLSLGSTVYGVTISENYAYVTTHGWYCDDEYCGPTAGQLNVVDVSNPLCPKIVSSVPTLAAPEDIVIAGKYAYIIDQGKGLTVADISNPASPLIVAYNTGSYYGLGIAVNGGYVYEPGLYGLTVFQTYGAPPPQPTACTP